MGDQPGDRSKAERTSLVVGETELQGIEPPLRAEVDHAVVIFQLLWNTSGVNHQSAHGTGRSRRRLNSRRRRERYSALPQSRRTSRLRYRRGVKPRRNDGDTGNDNSRFAEKVSSTSIIGAQNSVSSVDSSGFRRYRVAF